MKEHLKNPRVLAIVLPIAIAAWLLVMRESDEIPPTPDPSTYAGRGGVQAFDQGVVTLPDLLPQPSTTASNRAVIELLGRPLTDAITLFGRPPDDRLPVGDPVAVATWHSAIDAKDTLDGGWPVAHVVIIMKAGKIGSIRAIGTYGRIVWAYPSDRNLPTSGDPIM